MILNVLRVLLEGGWSELGGSGVACILVELVYMPTGSCSWHVLSVSCA
jgi:hypothetical protein